MKETVEKIKSALSDIAEVNSREIPAGYAVNLDALEDAESVTGMKARDLVDLFLKKGIMIVRGDKWAQPLEGTANAARSVVYGILEELCKDLVKEYEAGV